MNMYRACYVYMILYGAYHICMSIFGAYNISRWPLRGTETAGHGRENDAAKKKGDTDYLAAQLTRTQHGINRDTADTSTTDTAQRPTH